jgi:hypothetical protein
MFFYSLRYKLIFSQCYANVTFCPGIDAQCVLCPVVVHITCLDADERQKAYLNNFVCAFCVDDIEYSKATFLEMRRVQTLEVCRINAV